MQGGHGARKIDLGGVPEQGWATAKGMLYVVMQDAQGSVTAVDVKTMKAVAPLPLRRQGQVQRAGVARRIMCCSRRAQVPGNPACPAAQPMMGNSERQGRQDPHQSAAPGGSDGRPVFNPSTRSLQAPTANYGTLTVVKGAPTSFEVEQNLSDNEWRPNHYVRQQDEPHLYNEPGARPAPAAPPGVGRGPPGHGVPGSFTILNDRQVSERRRP